MEKKKQSSIDWLKDKLNGVDTGVSHHYFNSIIQEAKAMHKEEIENAWLDESAIFDSEEKAENYYTKTFGGNDE